MKKYMVTPVLVMLFTALITLRAQDRQEEYLGLPGDNLNLYAVMKLFQESETLEGFERQLNDQNSRINNLDLDGDGYVDYIRVIDNVDRNVHYIILQVAVNSRENQDVAVFTVVRESNGQVQIQLIGDEALYGRNYIIEPIYDETPNPGYAGNAGREHVVVNRTTTVEIAAWPLIRFIFLPNYIVWHSPWYYHYYPSYWRPWNPFYWHYYYGYHFNYHHYYFGHYRHWEQYRHPQYQSYYYGRRREYSPHVGARINDGHYKSTYSHPEQRKEGVAMYQRTHSDQNSGTSGNNAGNPAMRRSASESRPPRQSANTNTERRSTSNGTSRQSTGTNTQRQPAPGGTTQKSTGASTERRSSTSGNSRPSAGTNTEKRSPATQTGNSDRKTGTGHAATERHNGQRSNNSGVSNSGRRSSGSQSSGSSSKASEKPKSSSAGRAGSRR